MFHEWNSPSSHASFPPHQILHEVALQNALRTTALQVPKQMPCYSSLSPDNIILVLLPPSCAESNAVKCFRLEALFNGIPGMLQASLFQSYFSLTHLTL